MTPSATTMSDPFAAAFEFVNMWCGDSDHSRRRGSWTKAKLDYLGHVQAALASLSAHWPLTLRQVYYRLVSSGVIENATSAYKKLSRILTQARLDGLVPWRAMEDRARSTLASWGWSNARAFAASETSGFLAGYRRDLLQSQPVALEVWIEKDALSRICYDVAFPYCVPVVVARGFSSVSYVHECAKRINRNLTNGKPTVILYFGDLDPSGYEMLPSMMKTLEEEMFLGGGLVEGVRCALTPDQVEEHGLPHNPDALKWTDSRAEKYVARFGELAVELDALPPDVLQQLVRDAIEDHLDLSLLEAERQCEVEEEQQIDALRDDVRQFVAGRQ